MLKFCNMKITLKRVEDCAGFFEKTQISLAEQRKAMIDRKRRERIPYFFTAICFIPVRLKPSYL